MKDSVQEYTLLWRHSLTQLQAAPSPLQAATSPLQAAPSPLQAATSPLQAYGVWFAPRPALNRTARAVRLPRAVLAAAGERRSIGLLLNALQVTYVRWPCMLWPFFEYLVWPYSECHGPTHPLLLWLFLQWLDSSNSRTRSLLTTYYG